MLNREPMWLKSFADVPTGTVIGVSVLNREPMWLKSRSFFMNDRRSRNVSVLNREPMWLKFQKKAGRQACAAEFQCSTVSRCG